MAGFMNKHTANDGNTGQNRENSCTLGGDISNRSPEIDEHCSAEEER
jgi:hypothetical protein